MASDHRYQFAPRDHARQLEPLIAELEAAERLDREAYHRILRKYPRDGSGFFSKAQIVQGYRHLRQVDEGEREAFLAKIRMKPVRTASGVAPVTVLTKPYPCPGRCIFCPSDVRMPKSYLSDEPGAQRAAQHRFDPYRQTASRLRSYHNTGHPVDKVELIVLGGTWSFYPEGYQRWFVKRCFDALNDFDSQTGGSGASAGARPRERPRPRATVDGAAAGPGYNTIVTGDSAADHAAEAASWEELERVQAANETAAARCVGLSLETRPDHLPASEVLRLRRLGATKVQIGLQSLSDEVLRLNRRGHDVAASRRAMSSLRGAGFKIHAHWMPNLYGSSPAADLADFDRLFEDSAFRPDELKIYPCSLIRSAELMRYHRNGSWRPYSRDELLDVVAGCLARTPEYCRVTRVVRDIPGTDIVTGNRTTNFREVAERHLGENGVRTRDIRSREVRRREIEPRRLRLTRREYATSIGRELFLELATPEDRIAAFLRLGLPRRRVAIAEIATSAMIREVHVYGTLASLGRSGRTQHRGLGRRLVEVAKQEARAAGFADLAVISAVGTREYYRGLGFEDDRLYQHLAL